MYQKQRRYYENLQFKAKEYDKLVLKVKVLEKQVRDLKKKVQIVKNTKKSFIYLLRRFFKMFSFDREDLKKLKWNRWRFFGMKGKV